MLDSTIYIYYYWQGDWGELKDIDFIVIIILLTPLHCNNEWSLRFSAGSRMMELEGSL